MSGRAALKGDVEASGRRREARRFVTGASAFWATGGRPRVRGWCLCGWSTRLAAGLVVAVGVAGLGPAGADGAVWRVDPVPAPAPSGDCIFTSATRVPGHATVWVVGVCEGGVPSSQLVSERRRANGSWEAIPVPSANGGFLLSVAAVSGRDVWAVGYGGSPTGEVGLVEHWDGTAWAVVPSPDVGLGTAHITYMSGVAVASPTSVWAVGSHTDASNRQRTLVEHWDGSAWTVVPTPNANGLDNRLTGVVTVPSTGGVWAFGVHATRTGGSRQLILHRGRYGWAVARRQPLVPASRLDAGAVVPGASGGVWAVGEARGHFLAERHSASGWRVVSTPSGGGFNELTSAAAIPGTSHLWAIGSGTTRGALIMRWTGDSWRITPVPSRPLCPELTGVTAISRVDAWAVGYASGCGNDDFPLVERYH